MIPRFTSKEKQPSFISRFDNIFHTELLRTQNRKHVSNRKKKKLFSKMIKETEKMQRYFIIPVFIIPVQIEINLISLNMI
jgi:hypothetical protein